MAKTFTAAVAAGSQVAVNLNAESHGILLFLQVDDAVAGPESLLLTER